ncbi:hypothetical protein [Limnoglobus roseus]|uniref:Uncharacterized protein n=1 Tax=Limnoglobus roseus TaxID=2598579 RepID=A0A5C1ANG6_9BACT|nr:hypothetical protein [Limnoglobus roseus]QEL19687.1 hypothetical protein PX52LOC_06766 [Limnoglobus roseus]
MTLTRWKLMAGVLGISIVGVVAVANPQCPNIKKDQARETAPPGRIVAVKGAEIVTDVPPTVTPLTLTLPTTPTGILPDLTPMPVSQPPLPQVAVGSPPLPYDPPPAFKVDLTAPPAPPTPALPKLEVAAPTPVLPKVEVTAPKPEPAKVERVVELPLPGVVAAKPTAPVPELQLDLPVLQAPKQDWKPSLPDAPTPKLAVPSEPSPSRVVLDDRPATIAPVPTTPKKVEATPVKKTTTSEESAVRVMIHLGTGQPKFDVLAGDDVLLKAVCDNVDIRSPAEKGAGVTPLKAGGKVRFSAPGCEGTCDNLTVLPSTGEVELVGNVKVHCRMGKGETEINATTMKFKLGSAPAYAVPEPGVTSATFRDSTTR